MVGLSWSHATGALLGGWCGLTLCTFAGAQPAPSGSAPSAPEAPQAEKPAPPQADSPPPPPKPAPETKTPPQADSPPPPPKSVFSPDPNKAPPGAHVKRGPFDATWQIDAPILVTSVLIGGAPYVVGKELRPPYCGLSCDKSKVNALDRGVIGNHAQWASTVSDWLLYGTIAYPAVLDLIDVGINEPCDRDAYAGFGRDALVLGEVLTINLALNTAVKYAVGRPRPLVYDPSFSNEERLSSDAGLSFYSGHSSTTFAMATAYSYLFTLRHPHSPLVAPMWILTEGAAAFTAGLRVAAGMHFWTDILTGSAIGLALGALVPYLHTRAAITTSTPTLGKLAFRLTPQDLPGGAGLLLSVQ